MAPELFVPGACGDAASDIYALGITMYELVCGQRPFRGAPGTEAERLALMCAMHQLVKPIPPDEVVSDLPPGLGPLMCACLEKNSHERPSLEQVVGQIRAFVHETADSRSEVDVATGASGAELENKAINLLRLSRPQEALDCVGLALARGGTSFRALLAAAEASALLGHWEVAIEYAAGALQQAPTESTCWSSQGSILRRANRLRDAVHSLDRALELDERNAAAWHEKGLCLTAAGRHGAAIRCFEVVLLRDPGNHDAELAKADAFLNDGKVAAAIICARHVADANPSNLTAWSILCTGQSKLGRYADALSSCEAALAASPLEVDFALVRAELLCVLGQPREGLDAVDRVLDAHPYSSASWQVRGRILTTLGDHGRATDAFSQAVALDQKSGG
jgi:tetratricopeptide (TPR) repeat protein